MKNTKMDEKKIRQSPIVVILERYWKAKEKGKEARASILKENLIILIKKTSPDDMGIYDALKSWGNDFLEFVKTEIGEEKAREIADCYN